MYSKYIYWVLALAYVLSTNPAQSRGENIALDDVKRQNVTGDNKTTTTGPSVEDKENQLAAILIAVTLLTILTICVVLFIIRTMKDRRKDRLTYRKDKQARASENNADVSAGVKEVSFQDTSPEPNRLVSGIRKAPTRNMENRKWYNSAVIPFMDEVSDSTENLYV